MKRTVRLLKFHKCQRCHGSHSQPQLCHQSSFEGITYMKHLDAWARRITHMETFTNKTIYLMPSSSIISSNAFLVWKSVLPGQQQENIKVFFFLSFVRYHEIFTLILMHTHCRISIVLLPLKVLTEKALWDNSFVNQANAQQLLESYNQ